MTLEKLYEYAEDKNILIDEFKLHNKKAFAVEQSNNIRAIVIDKTKINNSIEEKIILSEELGHLCCNATCFAYNYTNPIFIQNIRKAESRAKAWSYKKLLPRNELAKQIEYDKNLHITAEHFGVVFSFLIDAIKYYKTKNKKVL